MRPAFLLPAFMLLVPLLVACAAPVPPTTAAPAPRPALRPLPALDP